MPKEIYLNITEIARLLARSRHFSYESDIDAMRAFFDSELKKGKNTSKANINRNPMVETPTLKRVLQDIDSAKQNPESIRAKHFLRDLYHVVYYLLGDEKSGLKLDEIQDKSIIEKLNLIRMKTTKSLTEKLQIALDSDHIKFNDFAKIVRDYGNALHNVNGFRLYDKKLVKMLENKLEKLAEQEVNNIDISPDGMQNEASNIHGIATVFSRTIEALYPDEKDQHRQELLDNWDVLRVEDKVADRVKKTAVDDKDSSVNTMQNLFAENEKLKVENEKQKTEINKLKEKLMRLATSAMKVKGLGKNTKHLHTLAKEIEK